jgi:hypothetical protein
MKREMCVEVGTTTFPARCPHYGGPVIHTNRRRINRYQDQGTLTGREPQGHREESLLNEVLNTSRYHSERGTSNGCDN